MFLVFDPFQCSNSSSGATSRAADEVGTSDHRVGAPARQHEKASLQQGQPPQELRVVVPNEILLRPQTARSSPSGR